jgi:hypothetical protein
MNRLLRLKPNLLAKATSNEAILVGATSKVLVESYLLQKEFATYALLFGSHSYVMLSLGDPSLALIPSMLITMGSGAAYFLAPGIAAVRTYNAIAAKNIHVMQLQ